MISEDGYVHIKIVLGMYGIKKATVIVYNKLVNHMDKCSYYPITLTTGLWDHCTRCTGFCLYVDNFGVKDFYKNDAYHLLSYYAKHYAVSTDWGRNKYLGLAINLE